MHRKLYKTLKLRLILKDYLLLLATEAVSIKDFSFIRFKKEFNFGLIFELILVGFSIYIIVSLLGLFYDSVLYPFQLEYREGAFISMVKGLENGMLPYRANNPESFYMYGPVFPILAYLLNFFTHDYLLSGRLVGLLSILFSCALLVIYLKRQKVNYPLITSSLAYFLFNSFHTAKFAFPSSLMVLCLGAMAIIAIQSNFSLVGLLLATFVACLSFFNKQYGVLGLVGVYLSHLIYHQFSMKSILHCTLGIVLFVGLVYLAVYQIFPYYKLQCLDSFSCSEQYMDKNYVVEQIQLVFSNDIVFSALLIALIIISINLITELFGANSIKSNAFISIKPYLVTPFLPQAIVGILVFYYWLGENRGSFPGNYLYHLTLFPILCFVIPYFSKRIKFYRVYLLISCFLYYHLALSVNKEIGDYDQYFSSNTKMVADIDSVFRTYTKVYASPDVVYQAHKYGHSVLNNGQTEYAYEILNCREKPNLNQAKESAIQFSDSVNRLVAMKDFTFVFFSPEYGGNSILNKDTLNHYYEVQATFQGLFMSKPLLLYRRK